MQYDPHRPVDATIWQAKDTAERIEAVLKYHRGQKIRLPNAQMHALIHTVVENQIAEGDTLPAKAALTRLMNEGLDRHEAVHALGSVVAAEIFRVQRDKTPTDPIAYSLKLERLTAESWRSQFQTSESTD